MVLGFEEFIAVSVSLGVLEMIQWNRCIVGSVAFVQFDFLSLVEVFNMCALRLGIQACNGGSLAAGERVMHIFL